MLTFKAYNVIHTCNIGCSEAKMVRFTHQSTPTGYLSFATFIMQHPPLLYYVVYNNG